MTRNRNAIQSISTKKSIDFISTNKLLNKESITLSTIEQKQSQIYMDNLTSTESNHHDIKPIVKSSYQIPSPTILLPGEFSSSPKSATNINTIINKIQRSSPIENNRTLSIFNQLNLFHLKNHIIDDDKISVSSINLDQQSLSSSSQISLSNTTITTQQIQTSQHIFSPKQTPVILPNRQIPNSRISLSQMINDLDNTNPILSQDIESFPFKLFRDRIENENIQFERPIDTSPQLKIHQQIKHEQESLWKTKLTLKTLLSMANRDDAQALKDRKPIDYHMFLTNKFNKKSIFQYNDHIDTKFTANIKQIPVEQDYKENRNLYKRLFNTMGLRKPINTIKQVESIKKMKTKRMTKNKKTIHYLPNNKNEQQSILINYQAVPISK
ncbi:unnamed protein product [Adineta steineri]|uniref:PLD phosphodiesterase domain-containing protein n=1 Tax=Adineta steineri TaxID=433720 RepID=A0A818X1Y8_9BILA|nr:unnamed protein product [Adineta steineri]CAF3734275.1 unnamed protein product [Adineta steineri]